MECVPVRKEASIHGLVDGVDGSIDYLAEVVRARCGRDRQGRRSGRSTSAARNSLQMLTRANEPELNSQAGSAYGVVK